MMNHNTLDADRTMRDRWDAVANPGGEHTERVLSQLLRNQQAPHRVLNCAIPIARAQTLTNFEMPDGMTIDQCLVASVTGKFPACLSGWTYKPQVRAVPQLPEMAQLPREHANLEELPWFQSPSRSAWLGINARHLRYHHQLWRDLRPKVLRGVHTTLVWVTPQIGYALTPHVQLEKSFLYLGALARGLSPTQLFPARYLYPDANLGGFADAPAPIFADILPLTGGFACPTVDCEPEPSRILARFGNGDRYYGYPFRRSGNSMQDLVLQNNEPGVMLLPDGRKVAARNSQSHIFATLDPELKRELGMDRTEFANATCLVRGAVTHDGLPFRLPVELQAGVFAVVLTQWEMQLDRPGDLSSYTLTTSHAAIRGFNFYQQVEPYYTNFMRLVSKIAADPDFRTYPLATHLTDSWLGGNLRVSNQLSKSESDLGPNLMRSYYHQQLDWQAGVVNLMNHVAFRAKADARSAVSRTGEELERSLGLDGLAFHQMNRLLRFDSHLFRRSAHPVSPWPGLHPGWAELDQRMQTETLPKI